MTKIGRYQRKRDVSKISVDSISFTSYTPLCPLILLHRLLCSINFRVSDTRIFEKLLLFHHEMIFCSIPLEKCVSKGRATKRCKKFIFFWERPLHEIWEYALPNPPGSPISTPGGWWQCLSTFSACFQPLIGQYSFNIPIYTTFQRSWD